ncbi:putative thioesterase [Leptolyngbyaceae cyanobacterium JSC-12]|nr:putative thioesterase [Leptolyngbyaceae cyanobacterium JSC-12]
MPFVYSRTVRFQDTDAAGVVYFANVLAMCHEAYEASLVSAGIDLKTFFSGSEIAIPIVHASVDFFKPMVCGDRLEIHLSVTQLKNSEFEIQYHLFGEGNLEKPLSQALTRHVCIQVKPRSRRPLPEFMHQWLHQWDDKQTASALPPTD